MNIAIAGLGYVGLSNAILLARHNRVTAVDISAARVDLVNAGRAPILDADCAAWLEAPDASAFEFLALWLVPRTSGKHEMPCR